MQSEIRGTEECNEAFKKFYAQKDNDHCFECNADAKEFVSVNNAISLCEKCAGVHRNFGDHISLVKSVKSPEWTSSELKLLEHGGNAKLKDFFRSYNFDAKSAPILKYKTLAAFYYRRKLRFESEGKEHPDMPEDKEKHLEEHENESFFELLTSGLSGLKEKAVEMKDNAKDLASQGLAAVKSGVTNAVEFIKEKTQGTTAEDVKETLLEKKETAEKKLESGAEAVEEKAGGLKEKLLDAKDRAVDLASKGIEAVKGQVSNAAEFIKEKTTGTTAEDVKETLNEKKDEAKEKLESGAEAVQEKASGLREKLHDVKEKAVDLASHGYEAVKGQVNNAVEFIKEKTTVEGEDGREVGLKESVINAKDQAVNLASKGIEAVKEQVSNAVDFIKEKAHIEQGKIDEKVDECADKECEEREKKEKELAEKRAKEQAELQEIANEAAESVKAHIMPSSTKSKADQIREQAAMIEAARGKTIVSKGKGVSKQIVQKGSADPEYIEKLLHGEEESGEQVEDADQSKKEKFSNEEEKLEGEKPHAEHNTTAKNKKKNQNQSAQHKTVLATLAKEASLEVEEHDPSKAFPAKDDETFPEEGDKKGFEEKEPVDPEHPEHHSLRAAIKDTALDGLESLKEKAQNTVDWFKEKVVAPLKKDAEFHAGEVEEKAGELKEKVENTVDSLKESDEHPSIGQRIKDKIVGGIEVAKDKALNAAEWVQAKTGLGEESVKNVDEAAGSPSKVSAEERKEGTFEKAQKINK